MIKNYFKIAWRNLLKSKWYSSINIIGLATGMAVALLIGLWIWDELSFDKYHRNYYKIAQLKTTQTFNDEVGTGNAVSQPMAMELRTKHTSDFKYVTLASWNFEHILAVGEKKLTQSGMWVQPEFPIMLTLKMLKGRSDALKDPSSILLTESLAKALFGKSDPMNQTIKLDNKLDVKVAGVFEDLPHNSSFYETKYLLSWDKYVTTENWLKEAETQWGNHSWQAFMQVNDNVDFDKTTAKIKDIPKKHVQEGKEEVILHPMSKWHLYSDFKNGKIDGGRIQFVWLFGIIGVFVLLLACINFMNLSTARSEKRAKEVGIRKTVGSLRRQLIGQFLSESLLIALLALVVAIALVALLLPFFNGLSDKQMSIPWTNPVFWTLTLIFTFFTGLVSGSYPAFYLSGFEPIKVLKGTFRAGRFASLPRKVLVVIQFTVSVTLIIGTIIVYRQIQFAKNRPVGYTREGLITVMMNTPDLQGKYNALRDELLKTGVLENMAESSSPVTGIWSNQIGFEWKGKDPNTTPLFGIVAATHDYGKTIGWTIKEGRDFSRSFPTDSGALILNESAAKLTGMKDPVGQIIKWNDQERQVLAVVKDMVMESPYTPVKPTIFFLEYGWASVITMRIKPTAAIRDALTRIEPVFRKFNPGSPFEYKFTDEEYAKKFENEQRIGNLATFFAILAIFISCLGLFGLASFVAEQRTKEIGVRKVLGASVFNLWQMLSKDFFALVIISCAIAIPIAWYFLHQWLQQYEYRTPVSWWVFVVAAMGALTITILTVSFQAIKAALANPIKSLRTE
jgi:ABC-type antimicrobial peptide transport system permease subunit